MSYYHSAEYSESEQPEKLDPPNVNADRAFQYDICQALNMTSFGVVIDRLVAYGMNKRVGELYRAQAGALLAQVLSEKNRIVRERGNGRT